MNIQKFPYCARNPANFFQCLIRTFYIKLVDTPCDGASTAEDLDTNCGPSTSTAHLQNNLTFGPPGMLSTVSDARKKYFLNV